MLLRPETTLLNISIQPHHVLAEIEETIRIKRYNLEPKEKAKRKNHRSTIFNESTDTAIIMNATMRQTQDEVRKIKGSIYGPSY